MVAACAVVEVEQAGTKGQWRIRREMGTRKSISVRICWLFLTTKRTVTQEKE
jgi:hypothetical protein